MHKASCDDNTYLITYLRDKAGFQISETDIDGNTPLHYACLTGADYASFWLLGFGQDCTVVNNLGETALHQLIKSEQTMQNTKTVREMIFKGADRDIKNNEDQTAKDLIDTYIKDETLAKELHDLLGP